MKKLNATKLLICAVLLCSAWSADGQKLSKIQKKNFLAPEGVKIDGDLSEWDGKFQAYNKNTLLYYTISNDDNNLYLITKTKESSNINKIVVGGISLKVDGDAKKKKASEQHTVTFPVVSFEAMKRAYHSRGVKPVDMKTLSEKERDSVLAVIQEITLDLMKEVRVEGFADISDSIVSVYNTHGIKAAASFDEEGAFVCEFAVPIERLNLNTNEKSEFAYTISVNGRPLPTNSPANKPGEVDPKMLDLISPTDLSGEYALAKE